MLAGTCKFDVRPPLTPLVVAHVQRGKTALNKHQLYQSMKLIKRNAITIGPHDASVLTFEGRRLIWRVPRRCLEDANLVSKTIFSDVMHIDGSEKGYECKAGREWFVKNA